MNTRMKYKGTALVMLVASIVLLLLQCGEKNTPPAEANTEGQNNNAEVNYKFPGEKHFGKIKMLTDAGENAEAYFSYGQDKLIYQSKSGGYECDQIFVMNLDGSGKQLVSTGKGRTTCSFFLPGDSLIIYASTHAAAEACPPPPDRSKGYVWQLYDTFDLFVADLKGNIVRRYTDQPGYDAEAVVSPLGDKIAFTSTRDGDPEIYIMDIDGSNQTRLTYQKGYDGGPFFSPDGQKIVFRASRPESAEELVDYDDLVKLGYVRPTALEVYVMNLDGSDIQQVTDFGKASFAPYFHPNGEKIIFSSNVNSETGRDFDLYMINLDGSGFEQITYNKTFDGFPMFTRDGKHLVFGSNRANKKRGDTNVFIAEWID